MTTRGFALFDTAIGACGIAGASAGWSASSCRRRPRPGRGRACGGAFRPRPRRHRRPPCSARSRASCSCSRVRRSTSPPSRSTWLTCRRSDRRVYEVARTIPPGATLSYGDIAARLGAPGEARAVGQALGQNPFPLVVPCHRVLGAGGKVGGFSANGGIATKLRLLSIEGARTSSAPTLFENLPLVAAPRRRR